MQFHLTRERSIILSVGAALLLIGAIYYFLPLFESAAPGEEVLAIKQEKLAKYREKAQEKNRLEAGLLAVRRRLQSAELGLLQANTPALAAVDIQQMVSQIANQTQAEVKTMRILGPEAVEGEEYTAVPVEVTLSSDIRQLVGVLYGIDNARKLLRIKNLTVRSAGARRNDKILSTFTVEGFMKHE
jgi:hypothetical protein